MRKNLLFFATAMLLMLPVLVSCSSDDNEELDGEIVVLNNGKRVLVKEIESYPDSVHIHSGLKAFKVPCVPIKKSDMPEWMYNQLFKVMGATDTSLLYQGEWIETGEIVYAMYNSASSSLPGYFYNASGNYFAPPRPIEDYYRNWKCIFIVERLDLE